MLTLSIIIKYLKIQKKFKTLALHNDGSIEMMEYKQKLILSTMFHPERKSISQNKVDLIFKNFLRYNENSVFSAGKGTRIFKK